jgi:hypothetical protein
MRSTVLSSSVVGSVVMYESLFCDRQAVRTAMEHGTLFEPVELSCGMFSIGKFVTRIVVSVGFG